MHSGCTTLDIMYFFKIKEIDRYTDLVRHGGSAVGRASMCCLVQTREMSALNWSGKFTQVKNGGQFTATFLNGYSIDSSNSLS
jgi:hypothetical protein